MEHISPRAKIDKSYDLINSRYSLSVVQTKILLSVISLIRPDEKHFKEYNIPISEFSFLVENDNYTRLRKEVKALMSQVLEINKDNGDWLLFNWFSKAHYKAKEGIITFKIDSDLKPYLLELQKNFSSYYLANIMRLTSEYAIRIYEMMKQYQKIGSRTIELSELHELFQTPKSYKAKYNNFKTKVLEQALKDINTKTDIKIEYKEIKTGRSVTAIHFIIKSQKQISQTQPNQDETPTSFDFEYDDMLDMKYDLEYFNNNPANKKMLIDKEVHYLKELFYDKERNNKLTLETDRKKFELTSKNIKKELDKIYGYILAYKNHK